MAYYTSPKPEDGAVSATTEDAHNVAAHLAAYPDTGYAAGCRVCDFWDLPDDGDSDDPCRLCGIPYLRHTAFLPCVTVSEEEVR